MILIGCGPIARPTAVFPQQSPSATARIERYTLLPLTQYTILVLDEQGHPAPSIRVSFSAFTDCQLSGGVFLSDANGIVNPNIIGPGRVTATTLTGGSNILILGE